MTRPSRILGGVAGLFLLLLSSAGVASTASSAAAGPAKLRGDLTALVTGRQALDPRLSGLAGSRPGEIPYFVVLSEPNDAARTVAITALGARILRTYRSVDAYAVASTPAVVGQVAALPWVKWLAPVEIVRALAGPSEPVVAQDRATTADIGAPTQWDQGVTGAGIRIAVLDTGLDSTHRDLNDLDFRNWSSLTPAPNKVVDSRNFVGGVCSPLGTTDGHGHGTHVAAIATGTGEGVPLDSSDNGKYAGIAPDAELAVAKVLTDAGAGVNSDLVAAMEWAAMPADPSATGCSVGANIVNMSIGSESRPTRLNSGSDVDFVSYVLDRLAVKYGTLFVAAAGNSGPFIGSALEAPGSSAQALSVAATAKDYDVNHDDTLSGDSCAGWMHPGSPRNDCRDGVGTQPSSISSFSSRGPSGDVWLRPDLAAPGYNIVSAQAASGTALAGNDLALNTRADPLYATATGTSMAAPATAGSAALILQAYRLKYGALPEGASGVEGLKAPAYALLRAAMMNTATSDLYESRWILTTDARTRLACPPEIDPLNFFCPFAAIITDAVRDSLGSLTLYEVRNRAADPYVGPLAEGAGKLDIGRSIDALRDGVVIYSAATDAGADSGTGHRDFQGSWQVGAIAAGTTQATRFVLHAAPDAAGSVDAGFAAVAAPPSDGSHAVPLGWLSLPAAATVKKGEDALVDFRITIPADAPAGTYTSSIIVTLSNGHVLHVPVFVSVALHDRNGAEGNTPGPQAGITSERDVFAKDDTNWPSAVGTPGTGANADWLVYPLDLGSGLDEARLTVSDTAAGDETYDLYLYDSRFDLIASTHPFAAPGVTNDNANDARGPGAQSLSLTSPASGRYYVAVNRARIGGATTGDFGSFALTLDEIGKSDVAVTLTDAPDPVAVGGTLTYTATVANTGPHAATDVVLTDPIPSGATLVSTTASQGSCASGATVTCSLGAITSGASATVTVTVSPTATGQLTNTVSVAMAETDTNLANNTASATTTVEPAPPAPDLSVTQTDAPDPVRKGKYLTYTITVRSTGLTSGGVTLTDALPAKTDFKLSTTSQGTCDKKPSKAGVLTCNLGDVAAGETVTVTIVLKPQEVGTITNSVTVASTSADDPDRANNTSTETTDVTP